MSMLAHETRTCNSCRIRVEYCTIVMEDDPPINIFALFPLEDDPPDRINSCPRCNHPLDPDSTSPLKYPYIEEERKCKSCYFPVIYQNVHAADSVYEQRWLVKKGGRIVPAENCPKCRKELSLRTTERTYNFRSRPTGKEFELFEVDLTSLAIAEHPNAETPVLPCDDAVGSDSSLENLHWRPTNIAQTVTAAIGTRNPPTKKRRSGMSRVKNVILFPLKKFVAALNRLLNPDLSPHPKDDTRGKGNRFHR